eukprot:TRINITY_DN4739_c0_g1_i4.p1 TRINITY_DN4739_c0_g1~~TRINITY_DN4739_c0_g1_i4.p1  ORF type:complete len:764 (+),score=155.71 TRINITY_DN4739_c0_g1_i4:49-2340(+)
MAEASVGSYFTPINGVHGDEPLGYLLELGKSDTEDGFNILLDCGWRDTMDPADIADMTRIVKETKLDCVLLSGSSFAQIGALPYLVEHAGLSCPIYCTQPVKSMGHITLYDIQNYAMERNGEAPYSSASIDESIQLMETLKFYEMHRITPKTTAIMQKTSLDDTGDVFISPASAGNLLGSCIWHIVKDTDDISYAPFFNHKSDQHLPPADLTALQKSAVCITSAKPLDVRPVAPNRDADIIKTVMETLRKDGNVLIPCDATGKVLELALLLEGHWFDTYGEDRSPYSIVFLCEYGECTVAMAEQGLEYMSDKVKHIFETRGVNQMSFIQRGIMKFCRNRSELDDVPGKKVIFATPSSMDLGYSLDIMLQWGEDKQNLIMIFDDSTEDSVTRRILEDHLGEDRSGQMMLVDVWRQVPLSAEEMLAWREKEQKRLDEESAAAELQRARQRVREIKDGDDDESFSDEESNADKELIFSPTEATPGLFLPKSVTYKSQHLMFPFIDGDACTKDEYGETVNFDILSKLHQNDDVATAVLRDLVRDEERDRRVREWEAQESARPKTVDELPIPKKYEKQSVAIQLKCKVMYFPFEGLADGNTLKHVIKTQCAHTQKLVIVNSPTDLTEELTEYAEKECSVRSVSAPKRGERVTITSDITITRVKLDDSLMSTIRLVDCGDYKAAYVEGIVSEASAEETDQQGIKRRAVDSSKGKYAVLMPVRDQTGQPATYIGELTLRKFSSQLRGNGWQSGFRKGSLVCDDKVCYLIL